MMASYLDLLRTTSASAAKSSVDDEISKSVGLQYYQYDKNDVTYDVKINNIKENILYLKYDMQNILFNIVNLNVNECCLHWGIVKLLSTSVNIRLRLSNLIAEFTHGTTSLHAAVINT